MLDVNRQQCIVSVHDTYVPSLLPCVYVRVAAKAWGAVGHPACLVNRSFKCMTYIEGAGGDNSYVGAHCLPFKG